MMSLAATALLAGLALLFIGLQRKARSTGLRSIPNAHFTAPFSRLWLLGLKWRGCENRTRLRLHRRFGPVLRIGPREISVDCVEGGVQLIYGRDFAKSAWYANAFYGNDPPFMFTMIGHHDHSERKKMLAAMYSKSYILGSSTLDECITNALGTLREVTNGWGDGQSIDVLALMRSCMMDITSPWLYGAANSTDWMRDESARDSFLATYAQTNANFFWRTDFSTAFSVLQALGIPVVSKTTRASLRAVGRWSNDMVGKALSSLDNGPPGLAAPPNVCGHLRDNLMRVSPEIDQSRAGVIMAIELLDHAIASHDVGGISLSYIMYELSRNCDRQRALRSELNSFLSKGSEDKPLSQRIDELPLLNAVVVETLRLRSPSPGPKPRVVPAEGCCIAGRADIPAGTVVSSSSWTLHRNPVVFPSPDEWLPERWLSSDEANQKEMKKWFWPFGSGTRMCIGNHFAMRAMKAIIVTIYTDFETSLVGEGPLEQKDAPKSGPVNGRVDLRFRRLVGTSV